MKAWKYKEIVIFGNSDKLIIKNYILKTRTEFNFLSQVFEYFKLKHQFSRNDLERLPFLDGYEEKDNEFLQCKISDEEKRVSRLKLILSRFDSLDEQKLKSLLMEFDEQAFLNSDYSNESWKEIEVKKIAGIMRFSCFDNWFEPFKILMDGRSSPEIKSNKIDRLIKIFEKDEKEFNTVFFDPKFKDIYVLYDSLNDKYFVTEDGSHRAFLAKILGMKTIMANVCEVKHF